MNTTTPRLKILTVDDDPNISTLVRLFLEKTHCYEVFVENHSGKALARAKEIRPDLILLDVDMPDKDGGEIAHELLMDPLLCEVPILFLTSLVSADQAGKQASLKGGLQFLAKPFNPKILVSTVDRILGT